MESNSHPYHLVLLPYPGRGHINPLLTFADHLLSTNSNLLITVILTDEWLNLLSPSSASPSLRFVTIPNVLPSESTRGDNMVEFVKALLTKMESPVAHVVGKLNPPADGILADSFLRWAPWVGEKFGLPVSSFFTQSANMFLSLLRLSGASTGEGDNFLNYLPVLPKDVTANAMSISKGENMLQDFMNTVCWYTTAQSLVFTSSYDLESEAVDALRSELTFPIYTVGPCIRHRALDLVATDTSYLTWLDSQLTRSVLYVSLGSYIAVPDQQIDEIYTGLKCSGVRFLWVTRSRPSGIEKLGVILPWCDQLRVLNHPAIGGFMTHCGWNSTMEAAYSGVPMLAHPLKWDQFPNSKMVAEDWKVGLRLRDENTEEEFVVSGEEIACAIKKVMESEEMLERADALRDVCRKGLGEDGSSSISVRAFSKDVLQRKASQCHDSSA